LGETALVTLGRLPKGLEIARALAGAGCRVVVADPFGWHLTRLSRAVARTVRVTAPNDDRSAFLGDLLRVVETERVTRVVPVSEEIFHVAGLGSMLPAGVRLHCEPQAGLLALHDKLAFARRLVELDLPGPETFAAEDAAARAFAARAPFVVKPSRGSSGHGLSLHDAGDEIPVLPEPAVVQALLPGEECSSFTIAHAGRVLGTVVYRARILSGTVAVCFERIPEADPALLAWVEAFAARTAFSGFLSFDFRRDADGRYLPMECNPRATSGIHFLEPADLARAILEPESVEGLRCRREGVLQQFFPALTATQAAALRGEPWRRNLRWLFGCRDVSWRRDDPLPFLLMTPASWPILKRTVFGGMSFGEATTVDVGWYE
jgi:predicted ATP-grasp superfamily ATP-dependent carboligase